MSRFGVHEVAFGPFIVRYDPTKITAMDKPLEEWRNPQLDGCWPDKLWEQFTPSS